MITLIVLAVLVVALVKGLRFVLSHGRREAARHAARQAQVEQMALAAREGLLTAADFEWTSVDDRQLARYISEVTS